MKRLALLGVVILALVMLAVPAVADDGGSVLPAPTHEAEPLPAAEEPVAVAERQPAAEALAETGFSVTTGALVAALLIAGGGVSLVLARRRAGS